MHDTLLSCPRVGHKTFEKSLPNITLGNAETSAQISKFVRPTTCVRDDLGIEYQPGELQKADLAAATSLFAYNVFVQTTFNNHRELFRSSECRIFQFQTSSPTGTTFVFGLFITDGAQNLIDFCVDSRLSHKRRPILLQLIRAICTPQSIVRRLGH